MIRRSQKFYLALAWSALLNVMAVKEDISGHRGSTRAPSRTVPVHPARRRESRLHAARVMAGKHLTGRICSENGPPFFTSRKRCSARSASIRLGPETEVHLVADGESRPASAKVSQP